MHLNNCPPYRRPFRASSIFRAASPALYPPFETQTALPSPNSIFSSTSGCGHGQWCGKWTQARVSGHRYLEQRAVIAKIIC